MGIDTPDPHSPITPSGVTPPVMVVCSPSCVMPMPLLPTPMRLGRTWSCLLWIMLSLFVFLLFVEIKLFFQCAYQFLCRWISWQGNLRLCQMVKNHVALAIHFLVVLRKICDGRCENASWPIGEDRTFVRIVVLQVLNDLQYPIWNHVFLHALIVAWEWSRCHYVPCQCKHHLPHSLSHLPCLLPMLPFIKHFSIVKIICLVLLLFHVRVFLLRRTTILTCEQQCVWKQTGKQEKTHTNKNASQDGCSLSHISFTIFWSWNWGLDEKKLKKVSCLFPCPISGLCFISPLLQLPLDFINYHLHSGVDVIFGYVSVFLQFIQCLLCFHIRFLRQFNDTYNLPFWLWEGNHQGEKVKSCENFAVRFHAKNEQFGGVFGFFFQL